jgi:tripartite-type tricarboxylate transporter receptor subunit TctC
VALAHRRQFLHLAAGAAALPLVSPDARAQTYPTRPVRIIVGYAPGGQADIYMRSMGQWLSERIGQSFVIENRSGGAGNIATEAVVRAPPDGYTLLLVGFPSAVNTTLFERLSFNLVRDVAPVAGVYREPNVVVVNQSAPARTISEFIAYAKANPGSISMASAGIGTPAHLAGELFKMMTGANMTHVPYRGGPPALSDLLAGQVQVMFAAISACIEYVRAGKLRPLAVTTASRSDALPDVPTVGDVLPGYEVSGWGGIGAPQGTPVEIIDQLNKEINAGLLDRNMKARFAKLGSVPLTGSPADFGELIVDETEKWAKVIRAANIRAE